jgi:hypothetical protein
VAILGDNDGVFRRPPSEAHKDLLRELQEERASALRRISRTLESLIQQLQVTRERIRQASGPDREREIAAWRDLRADAVKYRWYLEVQREALGLRQHDVLNEFYTVPTFD